MLQAGSQVEKLLRGAAGREEQHLAGVDEVGIANRWVRVGDAGGVRGVAKLSLRDLRKSVAGPHGELRGSPERQTLGRKNNLRACDDVVGIQNVGICGEQFAPTQTLAQILLGQFPE